MTTTQQETAQPIARHMRDFDHYGACACFNCQYDAEMAMHGLEYGPQF